MILFHKEPGFGYQFQARHVADCLRMGLTESPVMSHEDSLLIMETMDRIRAVAGIRYDRGLKNSLISADTGNFRLFNQTSIQ